MTFNNYTSPSAPIFSHLKLLKLSDIYKLKLGITTYCKINDNTTNPTNNMQLISTHSYNTRSSYQGNLFVPQVNTRLGQRSIDYQRAITWNTIPGEIKNSGSRIIFKKAYAEFLLQKY